MQNMKLSKEAATHLVQTSPGDGPAYPYGLTVYLDDDTLKKLGFTDAPAVGTEMMLHAKVVVTSSGVNQEQDGDKKSRCDLQITDMELQGERDGAADRMYSASGMNK